MFNELKNIIKHSFVYSIGNILSRALGFILIPVYTYFLTPAEYGILSLIEVTSIVAEVFLGLGISQSIIRIYYEYNEKKEKENVISTAFSMSFGIGLLSLFLLLPMGNNISNAVFGTPIYGNLFRLVFFALFFQLVGEVSLTHIRVKELSTLYTCVSVARTLLGLLLNIYLIVFLKLNVLGILISTLITTIFICTGTSYKTLREVGLGISKQRAIEMLKYGIPFIPGGLGMFVIHFGDRFFLEKFSTLAEVGIYSLGYKFGMILQFLILEPFLLIWAPKRFEIVKKENGSFIISRVFTYYSFVHLMCGLGLALLIKDVLQMIAGPAFRSASEIVPIIVLSYFLLAAYFHTQIGILLEKKTKYVAVIVLVSAIVNILLCWSLIPRYHSIGAALATLISFLVMFIMNFAISNRFYKFQMEIGRIAIMLLIVFALYFIGSSIDVDILWLSFIFKTLLVLTFPLILYIIGFFQTDEILLMKKFIKYFPKYQEE